MMKYDHFGSSFIVKTAMMMMVVAILSSAVVTASSSALPEDATPYKTVVGHRGADLPVTSSHMIPVGYHVQTSYALDYQQPTIHYNYGPAVPVSQIKTLNRAPMVMQPEVTFVPDSHNNKLASADDVPVYSNTPVPYPARTYWQAMAPASLLEADSEISAMIEAELGADLDADADADIDAEIDADADVAVDAETQARAALEAVQAVNVAKQELFDSEEKARKAERNIALLLSAAEMYKVESQRDAYDINVRALIDSERKLGGRAKANSQNYQQNESFLALDQAVEELNMNLKGDNDKPKTGDKPKPAPNAPKQPPAAAKKSQNKKAAAKVSPTQNAKQGETKPADAKLGSYIGPKRIQKRADPHQKAEKQA